MMLIRDSEYVAIFTHDYCRYTGELEASKPARKSKKKERVVITRD